MSPQGLASEAARIKAEFFPRWDRLGRWTVSVGSYTNCACERGHCDWQTRTIFISASSLAGDDLDELDALLIHEIAHAVTWQAHGQRWMARMAKAAADARVLGRSRVAAVLEDEVREYRHAKVMRAADVYSLVGEVLLEAPTASLDAVISVICNELGVRRERLVTKYRRLPKVYELEAAKSAAIWGAWRQGEDQADSPC